MQAGTGDAAQQDVWKRTGWLWTAVFHIILIIVTAVGLFNPANAGVVARILFLALALAAWQGVLFYGLKWRDWYERPWHMPLLVPIGILLWFLLVRVDPLFYTLLGGLFPFIYIYLRLPWAIAMTLVINALSAYDNLPPNGNWAPALFYWLGFSALSVLLGGWIYVIIRQSAQRRQLIEQLQATQRDLAAAERREGMMQERERLAREIHDTLAQGFTSIIMHLEAAEQALPHDAQALRHHLQVARDTARHSLAQARRVVQDLRPDLLAQQPLPEAIGRVVARWQEETGIQATAVNTGTPITLLPEIDVTLLRAVQEALANVHKHAQARRVQVTLSYMGDMVTLDVADDGVGLPGVGNGRAVASSLSGGFGLMAMRQRVAQLGGTVEIESEPGQGVTVAVAIPVSEDG